MKSILRQIGSVLAMGLIWAVGWALVGVLIAVSCDLLGIPGDVVLDPWIALALPGFVGGLLFSIVLRVSESGRRVEHLSLLRLAGSGAITGMLMGVLPFVLGSPNTDLPVWLLAFIIIRSTTFLSAVSAMGSGLVFRFILQPSSDGAGATG